MRRSLVLLNARAGTLIDRGVARVEAALTKSLSADADTVDIHLLPPRQLPAAIARAAQADYDTVAIGGGDGSASLAARAFAGRRSTLALLPLGTMNLLARDLGMPPDIDEAITALRCATPAAIDLARLNGRPFHSLSGLGFFSQMARAREETRGHPFGRFLGVALAGWRALRRTGRFTIEIAANGRTGQVDALAVLVTNNRFAADWRRPRLDEATLELHIVEEAGALAKLKAGADLLTGGWRDNPGIRSIAARELRIDHVRRRSWTATDGELARERMPLHYTAAPRALNVLMAKGAAWAA